MTEVTNTAPRTFKILRNGEAEPQTMDWERGIENVRQAISEAMNAKNVAFLLGAGCSSLVRDKVEVGKRLPSLPKQHALVFGTSVNLPTTFKVREASPRPHSDDTKIVDLWFHEEGRVAGIQLNNAVLADHDDPEDPFDGPAL